MKGRQFFIGTGQSKALLWMGVVKGVQGCFDNVGRNSFCYKLVVQAFSTKIFHFNTPPAPFTSEAVVIDVI